MNKLQWVGINVVALLAAGCESVPGPAESADRPFASVEEYRIGVDDRVQVTVWRNPELSVTAPVRPDGKISVPLIGDVEAGGQPGALRALAGALAPEDDQPGGRVPARSGECRCHATSRSGVEPALRTV